MIRSRLGSPIPGAALEESMAVAVDGIIFQDSYDAVAVVPQRSLLMPYTGVHYTVKSDVAGINQDQYDNAAQYGSATGRLHGEPRGHHGALREAHQQALQQLAQAPAELFLAELEAAFAEPSLGTAPGVLPSQPLPPLPALPMAGSPCGTMMARLFGSIRPERNGTGFGCRSHKAPRSGFRPFRAGVCWCRSWLKTGSRNSPMMAPKSIRCRWKPRWRPAAFPRAVGWSPPPRG